MKQENEEGELGLANQAELSGKANIQKLESRIAEVEASDAKAQAEK